MSPAQQQYYKDHPWAFFEEKLLDEPAQNCSPIRQNIVAAIISAIPTAVSFGLLYWTIVPKNGYYDGFFGPPQENEKRNYRKILAIYIAGMIGLVTFELTRKKIGKTIKDKFDNEAIMNFLLNYSPDAVSVKKTSNTRLYIPEKLQATLDILSKEFVALNRNSLDLIQARSRHKKQASDYTESPEIEIQLSPFIKNVIEKIKDQIYRDNPAKYQNDISKTKELLIVAAIGFIGFFAFAYYLKKEQETTIERHCNMFFTRHLVENMGIFADAMTNAALRASNSAQAGSRMPYIHR